MIYNELIGTNEPVVWDDVIDICNIPVTVTYNIYIVENTINLTATITSVKDPTHQYYNTHKSNTSISEISVSELLFEVFKELFELKM